MSDRAEYEKGALQSLWASIVSVAWFLPGIAGVAPYFLRPASYPPNPGVGEFVVAGIENLLGVFPYLLSNPWMAVLTLPTLYWLVSVIRWGPVVE